MRIPVTWSAPVLVILLGIGWNHHVALGRLRDHQAKLSAEIAARAASTGAVRSSRVSGDRRDAGIRTYASECADMSKRSPQGWKETREMKLRQMELMHRLESVGPAEAETFIAALEDTAGADADLSGFLGDVLEELAYLYPRLVLEHLGRGFEKPTKGGRLESRTATTIRRLATDDPASALGWLEAHPDFATDAIKQGLISGIAAKDPQLAFKLIDELGCEHPEQAASYAVYAARTSEERTAMIAALREYLGAIPDEKLRKKTTRETFGSFASGLIAEGFENGSKWMDQARLTTEELNSIARRLSFNVEDREADRWIEWAGEKLQDKERDALVEDLMFHWADKDRMAAEGWLEKKKTFPQRDLAIRYYVESVSRFEPKATIQWALVLPAGRVQEDALKMIYKNWPKYQSADVAEAEEFAKEHGIK